MKRGRHPCQRPVLYSESDSSRVKRFLNSFHSPNSEFSEVKTLFQTVGVEFENGPPILPFSHNRNLDVAFLVDVYCKGRYAQRIRISLRSNPKIVQIGLYFNFEEVCAGFE